MKRIKSTLLLVLALAVSCYVVVGCNRGMGEARRDPNVKMPDKSNK